MTTIYALVDPKTYLVRYVGQTTQPLKHRLRHHLYCARKYGHSALHQWINGLLEEDYTPQIIMLCMSYDGARAETFWITRFLDTGSLLTNTVI